VTTQMPHEGYNSTMPGDGPVSTFTEWDTLAEVIVGRLDGAVFPTWQSSMSATMPSQEWVTLKRLGGSGFPAAHLEAAQAELASLVEVLQREGVIVSRPDVVSHSKSFATPHWSSGGGLYAAMPRDSLLAVGDMIIEAPMSWRCRYFEADAFRSLIKQYFMRGARWVAAPRPQLTEELFTKESDEAECLAVTEFEPVFDAADFLRFGRDLVVQHSHVTNEFGIEWVRRLLWPDFSVHCIETNDSHAMHIDATLMPLAPGKLLVNPERYVHNSLFDGWEILAAPKPSLPSDWPMYMCSEWVSMNVLSISADAVVVESHEEALIDALTDWGFRCIPVDFRHVYSFGGSFHCVTLDINRRGSKGSYLRV
jgi:glycine amidinotransferase